MRDISMHLLDIVGNSVRAGAALVEVSVIENTNEDTMVLIVKDNGCGMDKETIAKAMDPFFTSRTTRKVGMGIPLLQQNAQLTGGNVLIESQPGNGTLLTATFIRSHIDRPPMGDLPGTLSLMVAGNPNVDFCFTYRINEQEYIFNSRSVKSVLDGVEISQAPVIKFIKEMINENLTEIGVEM
ncbi:Histidine kinase-, DNA gyrase B-, and HSP90-like ATPase [Saccharicrinis carchari]|uniref:histidine kinase n=1 Tax=Saccharicrinis carchari TaxID=1168039 RepID=A0A521DT97_SACCC|nr:ATP-binding protein [Saccharicrinis carchari]SMO74983.1 Histidine kinase-, DNA gyrase B-, and HSP90-like ATPase [Saccharicrinis carchari]